MKFYIFLVNELEYSRPTASLHWGWCSERCGTKSTNPDKLKETKVNVLRPNECKELGKEQRVNLDWEFCAGKKNFYPKTKAYFRIYSRKKNKFWYKQMVTFS